MVVYFHPEAFTSDFWGTTGRQTGSRRDDTATSGSDTHTDIRANQNGPLRVGSEKAASSGTMHFLCAS